MNKHHRLICHKHTYTHTLTQMHIYICFRELLSIFILHKLIEDFYFNGACFWDLYVRFWIMWSLFVIKKIFLKIKFFIFKLTSKPWNSKFYLHLIRVQIDLIARFFLLLFFGLEIFFPSHWINSYTNMIDA
jgi:hypothetical protein